MTTLRKRDKKREKQRAEEIARRKKKLSEPVVVEGKKRGKWATETPENDEGCR